MRVATVRKVCVHEPAGDVRSFACLQFFGNGSRSRHHHVLRGGYLSKSLSEICGHAADAGP